jgi:hypothetical protein
MKCGIEQVINTNHPDILMKPKMSRYLKYNIRWQSGFVVCYPCMWFFQDYMQWSTLWSVIAFQVVGANIFYHVDRWIFGDKQ